MALTALEKEMVSHSVIWRYRIGAIFLFAFMVIIFWWCIDRTPMYEYEWGEVVPADPIEDSAVQVHWRVNPLRFCPGTVDRFFIDDHGFWHRSDTTLMVHNPELRRDLRNTVKLPKGLKGAARYRALICATCNPLQEKFNWPICQWTPDLSLTVQ